MKRAFLVLVLFALLQSACGPESGTGKMTLAPEPQFGAGIYRIPELEDSRSLIWSPKDNVLLGLVGKSPYAPDCVPFALACWIASWGLPKFNSQIFLVNMATGMRRSLLQTASNEKIISTVFWMPDGQHIGCVVDVSANQTDIGTWSISTDGLNDQKVSEERIDPVWSPDGTRFAVEHDGAIFVAGRIGDQGTRIYHSELFQPDFLGMSWSADGKTIAFSIGKESAENPELGPRLYLVEVATGKVSPIPGNGFEDSRYPVFSPVGNTILYQHPWTTAILRDLRTDCEVKLPIPDLAEAASWSPDGTKLLVLSFGDKYRGYYIVDLNEFLPKFAATGSICP